MQNAAVPATFLARLWEIQGQRGLTDAALADLIGIDRPYMSRLKSGLRGQRPSARLVLSIVRAFPELGVFLGSDVRIGNAILPIRNGGPDQ